MKKVSNHHSALRPSGPAGCRLCGSVWRRCGRNCQCFRHKSGTGSGRWCQYHLSGGSDEEPDATDMADTIAKLQKRVENYSKEAIVYQEGTDRINIEIPGVTDANKILEELGRPGSLYFIAETDKDGNANYSMQAVTDAQGNVACVRSE